MSRTTAFLNRNGKFISGLMIGMAVVPLALNVASSVRAGGSRDTPHYGGGQSYEMQLKEAEVRALADYKIQNTPPALLDIGGVKPDGVVSPIQLDEEGYVICARRYLNGPIDPERR